MVVAIIAVSPSAALGLYEVLSSTPNSSVVVIPIQHMSRTALDSSGGRSTVALAKEYDRRRVLQEGVAPVRSGYSIHDTDYYARLTVGGDDNSRDFYFTIDTASELMWIQCQPCRECYPQLDEPVFDPGLSTTLTEVDGRSPLCTRLDSRTSAPDSPTCTYRITYSDQSYTLGKLVKETIALQGSGHSFPSIALGCSDTNRGDFNPTAGILALGRNLFFSLPFQLRRRQGNTLSNIISYCFPRMYSHDTSTLTLGSADGPIPPNIAFTPLITNPVRTEKHLYFVQIIGISVGGRPLVVPRHTFHIDPRTGKGGTIIDTGSTLTDLHKDAYRPLLFTVRNAISAHAPQLVRDAPYEPFGLDTCYVPQHGVDEDHLYDGVPSVVFRFAEGAQLEVPSDIVLIHIDNGEGRDERVCVSFAPSASSMTVLGNLHQQRIRITIDNEDDRVGFTPNAC
ncbi:hypothetical protein L7F22_052302 [Adiantum nelumboides]|nr:hypothetical protein [Adiantum nelumboides]